MSKGLYFGLGAILGAAGGSVATYFLTKEMFAQQAAEDIEAYAEHCEERIERLTLEMKGMKKMEEDFDNDEESEAPLTNDPNEDAINRNEGVKKYHHSNGLESAYGTNQIFEKTEHKLKEKDSKLISDIDEDEFMNQENGYEKQTIDVFLGDDKYMCGVWGYGTDNEDDADRKWGKPLEDLIGRSHTYDELLSYCEGSEDDIGLAYVRNDEMMIEFELVIHDCREDDK